MEEFFPPISSKQPKWIALNSLKTPEQSHYFTPYCLFIEGSLEVKLPTIWRDEKQSREEAERRERLEERRVEEKE